MISWQHDQTGRLRREEIVLKELVDTLSGDSKNSHSNTMADNRSVHDEQENEEAQNNPPIRTLREYLQPTRTSTPSCMIFPTNMGNFDLKPGVIQLLPKFHGLDSESPYLHLKEFEEVCATLQTQTINDDVVRLKLFPFSLKEKAKNWLNSLRPRSIGTWQEMQREFLKKFFPTHRTNTLRINSMNFSQKENETFFQCWERFKELLLTCPHHGYETWRTISFFYEGLTSQMRQFVEMMCNSDFLNKDPDDAWDYFDQLAENAQSWDNTDRSDRSNKPKLSAMSQEGIYVLKGNDDVNAGIASLTRKVEAMELRKVNPVKASEKEEENCGICEISGHLTQDCPTIPAFKEVLHEQANAMNSYMRPFSSPYLETYNPGWRNHPNFS